MLNHIFFNLILIFVGKLMNFFLLLSSFV